MAKKCDACLEVARGLKTIDPEHRFGWLHEARDWVGKSIALAGDQETLDRLRLRVLEEPALEAIWMDLQGG